MGLKLFIAAVASLWIALLVNKESHLHSKTKHGAAEAFSLSTSSQQRPYYTTGSSKDLITPKISILDLLTRKKINSFIVNHYNHYRYEMTFIDIGYSSQFVFKISTQANEYYEHKQKIGFSLSEEFFDDSMNFDFNKPHFKLKVRQYTDEITNSTITNFNISITTIKANFTGNITHILNHKDCVSAIREKQVISHKCYGGIGAGRLSLERRLPREGQMRLVSNIYNVRQNLTRVGFDGLRGSSMHWDWVWAEGVGFSKPEFYSKNQTIEKQRYLAINFGALNGQGQDFVFINSKMMPFQGVSYRIDENQGVGANITFKATNPKAEINFAIVDKQVVKKDLGIAYIDMVIFYGLWDGYVEEEPGKPVKFYEIAGIVETSDSFF